MALNKVVSKGNFLTREECLEKVKKYKKENNLKLSEEEIFNFHLESVLNFNKDKKVIKFDLSNSNKEKILKEALNTNNDIVITSNGLLGDLDKFIASVLSFVTSSINPRS